MRQGWAAAYPDAWASSNYEAVFMAVEAKVVEDKDMSYDNTGKEATAVQLIV